LHVFSFTQAMAGIGGSVSKPVPLYDPLGPETSLTSWVLDNRIWIFVLYLKTQSGV